MARTSAVAAAAALIATATGGLWWLAGGSARIGERADAVLLPGATAPLLIQRAQPIPSTTSGLARLSHRVAPNPEALANDARAQAAYDAAAQPGDFVTPPQVSIAH